MARPLAGLRWLLGDGDGARRAERTAAALERAAGLHRFRLIGEIETLLRTGLDAAEVPGEPAVPGSAARSERNLARWHRMREVAEEAARRGLVRIEADARSLLLAEATVGLTARQIEVLRELTTDAGLHVIAERLAYSHGTIRREAGEIYRRLGVDGRGGAARLAALIGLAAPLPAPLSAPDPHEERLER